MLYIYRIKQLVPEILSFLNEKLEVNQTYNINYDEDSPISYFLKKNIEKLNNKIVDYADNRFFTAKIQTFNKQCQLDTNIYDFQEKYFSNTTIIINLSENQNERFFVYSNNREKVRDKRIKMLSFFPDHLDAIAFDNCVNANIYINNNKSQNKYLVINKYYKKAPHYPYINNKNFSFHNDSDYKNFYLENIPQKDISIITNLENTHDPEFFLKNNYLESNYVYFMTDPSYCNLNDVTSVKDQYKSEYEVGNINVDFIHENTFYYYYLKQNNYIENLISYFSKLDKFPIVLSKSNGDKDSIKNFDKIVTMLLSDCLKKIYCDSFYNINDKYIVISNNPHLNNIVCDRIILSLETNNNCSYLYHKDLSGNYNHFTKLFNKNFSMLFLDCSSKNIISYNTKKNITFYIYDCKYFDIKKELYFNNIHSDNILDLSYNSIEEFNITQAKPLIFESDMSHFKNTDNFSDSSYNLLWEYDISYQELSKEYVINNCDYTISTEYLSNDLIESSCDYDEKQQINLNQILRFDSTIDQHSMSLLTKDISTLNFHDNNFLVSPETNKNLFFLYLKLFQSSIAAIIEKKYPVFEINLDSISIYRYNKDSKKKHNILPYKTILACFYLNDTTTDNSFDTILSKHFIDNPAGTLLIHTWMKKTIFKTNYTDYKYVLTYNISIT